MKKPRKQCRFCPWKVGVNPHDIPHSYCTTKHRGLVSTIAEPGSITALGKPVVMMACHETGQRAKPRQLPCVGWLENQLGVGNNIALRLAVAHGQIDVNVETVGPQHPTLEDTLPKEE